MKLRARIVVPILAAVAVTAGLLGIVWWQITTSQEQLRADVLNQGGGPAEIDDFTMEPSTDISADSGDRVLLHLRQGDLLAAQGEWAGAESEYQAAVNGGGGLPALRKLAQSQLQRRDMDGAKATIEKLKAAGVKQEDLLLINVILALRTGELVKAKDELTAAADTPQKHYGQALLAIIQSDQVAAKTELDLVIGGWDPTLRAYARTLTDAYDEFARFPDSRPLHLQTLLARALAQVQECELALPLLTQVLQEEPEYRDAWMVQGYCELTTERPQQALSSFDHAYVLDPEKPEIQYFLGRASMAMKDWTKAATYLQYALQNGFTPEKEVRRQLAEVAMQLQDTPMALEQLQKLMAAPDSDMTVAEKLIPLLLSQNMNDEAYTAGKTAINRWSQNARAYDLAASAAIALGNKDEAKTLLEKALQLDPTLQSARERYGKL